MSGISQIPQLCHKTYFIGYFRLEAFSEKEENLEKSGGPEAS